MIGGPFQNQRTVAGIPAGTPTPGLPTMGMEPDVNISSGLSPIMANDSVPSLATTDIPPEMVDDFLTPSAAPTASTTSAAPSRGVSIGDAGFGWAVNDRDFAPAGHRPTESRSTQVGKYSGSPLFAASSTMPFSVLSSRIQSINQEKKKLDAAIQSFNPETEDVNSPKYRDSFNRAVMGSLQGHIDETLRQYGRKQGYAELRTPTSPAGRRLKQLTDEWNTVSRSINQSVTSATEYLQGVNDGTNEPDDDLEQEAANVIDKLGSYESSNDPKELARILPRFNQKIEFMDAIKKDGVMDILKNGQSVEDIVERVKKGELHHPAFVSFLNKKVSNADEAVEALTDHYAKRYPKIPREELHRRFSAYAPNEYSEKLTSKAIPKPKGSGNDEGGKAKYTPDATVLPTGITNADGTPITGIGQEQYRPTLNLLNFVSKQGRVAAPLTFRDGNTSVFMHPERVMDVNGNLFVLGKKTGMPRTRAEAMAKGMSDADWGIVEADPDSQQAMAVAEKFNLLQDVMVPLEGQNESLLESALGVNTQKAREALGTTGRRSGENAQAPASPAPATGAADLKDAASFDAKYKALPMGSKFIGPDGKTYTKTK